MSIVNLKLRDNKSGFEFWNDDRVVGRTVTAVDDLKAAI
ncbi:hypothetical protein AIOL_002128 [Candidatus Rhodobacter oscarellae]|uniref:Uncharacterized protein n=1 Tax=Candidatus Rhodobacter oscarellae TaxID=1675527 RepID=A0A0J9E3A5_9RHOB|nr:hypothetical protein AIOL_002128 [Candidatus Rhodobacter lobularis]